MHLSMRGLRRAAVQPNGDALIDVGLMPAAVQPNGDVLIDALIDAGRMAAAVQPKRDALIGAGPCQQAGLRIKMRLSMPAARHQP